MPHDESHVSMLPHDDSLVCRYQQGRRIVMMMAEEVSGRS